MLSVPLRLLHILSFYCRDLWDYISKVSVEMNRLTDSVKEDPDKIAIYIKTAPEKRFFKFQLMYYY